jgi:hypothetical protein
MKFGKQFHYERVASGPLADALPWIDYGCVRLLPTPTRREICRCRFLFLSRRNAPPDVAMVVRSAPALVSRRANPRGAAAVSREGVARSKTVV